MAPLVFAAQLGFAVAIGVLLDTMVVSSVLVTALTRDVGRWMWWPSKLFKLHDPQSSAGEFDPEPALSPAEEHVRQGASAGR
jgi:RND superfamily putative drug exporter